MNRIVTRIGFGRLSCAHGIKTFVSAVMISGVTAVAQQASPIPGLAENHCSEIAGTPDSEKLACLVWDGRSELFSDPLQIEIYSQGRLLQTIEPGGSILEWHWWKDGQQISVHFGHPGTYALYDAATGAKLQGASEKPASTQLPPWAKSRSERADESVPLGPRFTEQGTQWMTKILRGLQSLHAGMMRKDLQPLLKIEGGLSTREERTYVSRECPLIKVRVRFKLAEKDIGSNAESPEDTVESISRPYLEFAIYD